jgi:hypothetical protein
MKSPSPICTARWRRPASLAHQRWTLSLKTRVAAAEVITTTGGVVRRGDADQQKRRKTNADGRDPDEFFHSSDFGVQFFRVLQFRIASAA